MWEEEDGPPKAAVPLLPPSLPAPAPSRASAERFSRTSTLGLASDLGKTIASLFSPEMPLVSPSPRLEQADAEVDASVSPEPSCRCARRRASAVAVEPEAEGKGGAMPRRKAAARERRGSIAGLARVLLGTGRARKVGAALVEVTEAADEAMEAAGASVAGPVIED